VPGRELASNAKVIRVAMTLAIAFFNAMVERLRSSTRVALREERSPMLWKEAVVVMRESPKSLTSCMDTNIVNIRQGTRLSLHAYSHGAR